MQLMKLGGVANKTHERLIAHGRVRSTGMAPAAPAPDGVPASATTHQGTTPYYVERVFAV